MALLQGINYTTVFGILLKLLGLNHIQSDYLVYFSVETEEGEVLELFLKDMIYFVGCA